MSGSNWVQYAQLYFGGETQAAMKIAPTIRNQNSRRNQRGGLLLT